MGVNPKQLSSGRCSSPMKKHNSFSFVGDSNHQSSSSSQVAADEWDSSATRRNSSAESYDDTSVSSAETSSALPTPPQQQQSSGEENHRSADKPHVQHQDLPRHHHPKQETKCSTFERRPVTSPPSSPPVAPSLSSPVGSHSEVMENHLRTHSSSATPTPGSTSNDTAAGDIPTLISNFTALKSPRSADAEHATFDAFDATVLDKMAKTRDKCRVNRTVHPGFRVLDQACFVDQQQQQPRHQRDEVPRGSPDAPTSDSADAALPPADLSMTDDQDLSTTTGARILSAVAGHHNPCTTPGPSGDPSNESDSLPEDSLDVDCNMNPAQRKHTTQLDTRKTSSIKRRREGFRRPSLTLDTSTTEHAKTPIHPVTTPVVSSAFHSMAAEDASPGVSPFRPSNRASLSGSRTLQSKRPARLSVMTSDLDSKGSAASSSRLFGRGETNSIFNNPAGASSSSHDGHVGDRGGSTMRGRFSINTGVKMKHTNFAGSISIPHDDTLVVTSSDGFARPDGEQYLMDERSRKFQNQHYSGELTRVEPFLYMGSLVGAKDEEQRKRCGITVLLDCAKNLSARQDHCAHTEKILANIKAGESDVEHCSLHMRDRTGEDATGLFYNAIEIIESVRQANGVILVHCLKGISRSAAVVLSYLMWKNKWAFDEAMNYLKSKRPTVNPNTGFVFQLHDWATSRPSVSHRPVLVYKVTLSKITCRVTGYGNLLEKTEIEDAAFWEQVVELKCNTKEEDDDDDVAIGEGDEPGPRAIVMPVAAGPLHEVSSNMTFGKDSSSTCYLVCPTIANQEDMVQYVWCPPECRRPVIRAALHVARQLFTFEDAPLVVNCMRFDDETPGFLRMLSKAMDKDVTFSPRIGAKVTV